MPATHPDDLAPLIEEAADVDATPARVWELLADVRNLARWSPQVVRTFARGRSGVGLQMINVNRRGLLFWPTRAEVIRYEPDRALAFRVRDNLAVWSFELTASEAGTTVVHRREMPDGTTAASDALVRRVLGGQPGFTEELRAGMARTLAGLKREAEA